MDTQTASVNTNDSLIFDATTNNFQEKVLKRSAQIPVVVDFWAEWCGPCRMLTPVLEKAITNLQGKVVLAKVNTDKEPELALRYRASSIPLVKAFRDGNVVGEFVGARDATFVRLFLEKLLPSKETELLEEGKQKIKQGAFEEAKRILSAVDPRSSQAAGAEQLLQLIDFLKQGEGYVAPLTVGNLDPSTAPVNPRARYAKAAALAKQGHVRASLDELLELVRQDRTYKDDGGRKAMLLLFAFLGGDHPLVSDYRRKLQLIL